MKFIKVIIMMLLLIFLVLCIMIDEVIYEILINEFIFIIYEVGVFIIYIDFFIIKDSLGNRIIIEVFMLDVFLVDMFKVGSYVIKIFYEGVNN